MKSTRGEHYFIFYVLYLITVTYGFAQTESGLEGQDEWYKQGKTFYKEKSYKNAILAFERTEAQARVQGDTIKLMNSLSRLGLSFIALEDYNKSEDYYRKALKMELKYGDSSRIARAFNNIGIAKYYTGELDSCLFYYQLALDVYRKTGKKDLPEFLKNIGLIYQRQGRYEVAAEYLFESARKFETLDKELEAASVYNIIGIMYNETGDDELALTYHKKALKIRKKAGEHKLTAQSLNNIGNMVRKVMGNDSALVLYQEALLFADSSESRSVHSTVLNDLGEIYLDKKDIEQSKTYFQQSLEIKRLLNDQQGIAHSTYNLARIALLEKKQKAAENYILEGLPIAKRMQVSDLLLKYYGLYASFLSSSDRYAEANLYYRNYKNLKDSILNGLKLKAFSEAEVKYRTDKLEEEVAFLRPLEDKIEILNLKAENQQARLRSQQIVSWSLGIGVIMLLVLAVLAWRIGKQRKKINELLALKNQEIDHRVRNNLSLLISIFNNQSRLTDNEELKLALEQGGYRIKSISHLHDRLIKEPEEGVSSKLYFEGLIDDLLFSLDFPNAHCSLSIDEIRLETDRLMYLGILLNELITNAVKHGLKEIAHPDLEIAVHEDENYVKIKVADNGPGWVNDSPEKSKSFGMHIIDKLAKQQLKGTLDYYYKKGAVFTIKIPV